MSAKITDEDLLQMIRQLNQGIAEDQCQQANVEPGTDITVGELPEQYIEVINNSLHIHALTENYLSIEAAYPVQLNKTGALVEGKTFVNPTDHMDWNIAQQPLFNIQVTPDKMQAFLQVLSVERYEWTLKTKPAARHMVVEAEEDRSIIVESLVLSDVMSELQRTGISKNIKSADIFKELQFPTYEPTLIAEGVPLIPSVDASVDLFFSEKIESTFEEVDGSVDFRNHLRIPTAKKGEVIAKKKTAYPGVIGYDIYGHIVSPTPPKDIILFAKNNTEKHSSTGEILALKNGRRRMTGTSNVRYFDITTAHVVSGDVDLRTGNIVFSGDVVIYGNVMEDMIIESLGNVYVTGNVYRSTITSTGSICVKGNIINSKLFSGYFGVIFNRLYIHTKKMTDLLHGLVDATRLLIHVVEAKGKSATVNQIVAMLIETKFNEIPRVAKEVISTISNIQNIMPNDMMELKNKMHLLLTPATALKINSLNEVMSIKDFVQEAYEMVERIQETDSLIDIPKCQYSEIKSTGSTVIRGEGVLQSTIYAKEDIVFLNKESVFRGGQLECGGSISAYKIGGDHGSESFIKAGKKVMLKRMSSGKIMVGKHVQQIFDPIENVEVLIMDNRLVFQPIASDGE